MLLQNIVSLCNERGITLAEAERSSGIAKGTMCRWGKNTPSVDKVKAVADFFGVTVDELLEAQKNGTLEECFGTGTAAVISPVGKLRYVDEVMTINGGNIGALSQKLYDTITGIQTGILPDNKGWRVKVGK